MRVVNRGIFEEKCLAVRLLEVYMMRVFVQVFKEGRTSLHAALQVHCSDA